MPGPSRVVDPSNAPNLLVRDSPHLPPPRGGPQPGAEAGPVREKGSGRPVPPRTGGEWFLRARLGDALVPGGGEAKASRNWAFAPCSGAEQQGRALPHSTLLNSSLGP